MPETLCTSPHVKLKAGVNHTALTSAQYTQLINEAEGHIVADTRVNWLDIYSTMNADFKQILQDAASSFAANGAIMNDPLALGGMAVATTMVNKNLDAYDRAISKLKDSNVFEPFGGSVIT